LQERILSQDTLTVSPSTETLDDFTAHFGGELGRECWKAWLPKHIDIGRAVSLTRRLKQDWHGIRQRLKRAGRPAADIEHALKKATAPTTPEAAGIPDAFYSEAVRHARLIRDRFTSLDLAAATGLELPVAQYAHADKN
jgi:glycerol-1-phosphate dehydrogenase [NAD(P)+]